MRPSAQVAALREFALPVVLAAIPPRGTTEGESGASSSSETTKGIEPGNGSHPKLLIHLFSGGGSLTIFHLRKLFSSSPPLSPSSSSLSTNQKHGNGRNENKNNRNENEHAGNKGNRLPQHTITFDSAPPQFRYSKSYTAIASGIPSSINPILRYFVLAPLIHAWCCFAWVQHFVTDSEGGGPFGRVGLGHNDFVGVRNTTDQGAAAANDGGGNDGDEGSTSTGEVRRTYIYSEADALVDWRDVESHAAAAVEKGLPSANVRLEKFEGSMHVAHARADEGRYWRVVRETWEGLS